MSTMPPNFASIVLRHSWGNPGEWARIILALADLSDAEIERLIDASKGVAEQTKPSGED